MNIWTLIMLFLIFYLGSQMLMMRRQSNDNNRMVRMLDAFQNEEEFFQTANEVISTETSPVLLEKEKVIKLWGEAYHNHEEDFKNTLSEIKLEEFLRAPKGRKPYDANEDAFFYLYLVIPNNLYSKGRFDLIDLVNEKLKSVEDIFQTALVKKLSEENLKYYRKEEDKGKEFYKRVIEGDYAEYDYSKQLIRLYKGIVGAMLVSLCDENEEKELYEDAIAAAESFNQTNLGKRWLNEINVVLPSEKENVEEEVKEESTEEKE